jgi:hypothetical protein
MSDELTSDIAYLIGLELSHGEASLVGEETLEVELPPLTPGGGFSVFLYLQVGGGRGRSQRQRQKRRLTTLPFLPFSYFFLG